MLKPISALLFGFALSFGLAVGPSIADNYPSKPIRMLVGFRAGGSSDASARLIARELQKELGTPVIVENLPGGGGRRAYESAYSAAADGYTLLLADMPSMQIGEIGYGGKYKTLDFTYLEQFFSRSHAVAVLADSPIKTFSELVAAGKKKRMTFSSSGIGTTSHLQAELMRKYAGLTLTLVPYNSGKAATAALMGGKVDATVSGISGALTAAKTGKVRILAVLLDERLKAAPNVPTLKELGFPKAYFTATTGILAPPKLPAVERDVLQKALEKIAHESSLKSVVERRGQKVDGLGPDAYYAKAKELMETISDNIAVMKPPKK
jgi:tripartite-type tricarboxylate transporter receptor subunit TctC